MVKSNAPSKSVWAQFGRGTKGRDIDSPSAPMHVTASAQANAIHQTTTTLVVFTPQRREQLPERPSTSGGPVLVSGRKRAERRETKDDLYFNPLAAHGKGTTFYNFPLPGSLPTPANSPKDEAPPTPRKSPSSRPPTPDSMGAVSIYAAIETTETAMEVPHQEIGMALGSPAHPPTSWHQGQVDVHSYSPSPDHMDSSTEEFSNPQRATKQKKGGWKLFGGLFGAKKSSPSTAFYQVQPEGAATSAIEADFVLTDAPNSSEKKPRGRGRSVSDKASKKDRPDAKRSETAPVDFNFLNATPSITLEGQALVDNGSGPVRKNGRSLLDVDIPDIHMERYSIMFGSVLGKSSNNTSSLLARRQATLDKLKTVNEGLVEKEHELDAKAKKLQIRRATSPVQSRHSQSPAFSLFPNTPSKRDNSPTRTRQSSNLRRSNTSPAALSPSRPTFAPGLDNKAHANIMSATSPSDIPIISTSPTKLVPKPSPLATNLSSKWRPEESHLILDSPSDMEPDGIYDVLAFPTKPKLSDPNWQMENSPRTHAPAASVSESSSSSSESSASTSASSVSTPRSGGSMISRPLNIQSPTLPSGPRARAATLSHREIPKPRSMSATRIANSHNLHEDEDPETLLKSAADVSIARQISVSRQQRQLLVPIKNSGSVRKAREATARRDRNQEEERTVGGNNFPVPAGSSNGRPCGLANATISVAHVAVASPLGAVATAAQEEHFRGSTPVGERKERERVRPSLIAHESKRLVKGVKPSTPTLVIVGDREEEWAGATAKVKNAISEARREKEGRKDLIPGVGEIRVGLSVQNSDSRATELQHRKSSRVVVERMSEDSLRD